MLKKTIPHIPPGDNRFEPLSNLREDTYQPTYNQHKSQPAQSLNTNGKKQRKVILLDDSHIRGCSEKLADLVGNSYRVIGITKPNANMKRFYRLHQSKNGTTNKEKCSDPL